jgi:hypothetical protein
MHRTTRMPFWVTSKRGVATTGVSAFSAEDAVMQARELARQGYEQVMIRDQGRREISPDELERSLTARSARITSPS